jgi:hypothetical protein
MRNTRRLIFWATARIFRGAAATSSHVKPHLSQKNREKTLTDSEALFRRESVPL